MNCHPKYTILVIGKNTEILNVLFRLINATEEYVAVVSSSIKDDIVHQASYDIVLLSSGISNQEEEDLRHFMTIHKPNTKIIQHYGGGSGLLLTEIKQALGS